MQDATGSDAVRAARGVTAQRPRVAAYADLTKPKQTGLLMATAVGAYLMAAPSPVRWGTFVLAMAALCAAVSGSTALNMVLDRDVDARMVRTKQRPLPSGEVTVGEAVAFGGLLAVAGVGVAWRIDPLYGAIVAAGLVFDVAVYTWWLKRRSASSILIGGVAGGMPALAGRTLATGSVDAVGLLLATGVLLWIPAHILTLAMAHASEYEAAGIPVWPLMYGETSTRRLIAGATAAAAAVLLLAGVLVRIHPAALAALAVAGVAMTALAAAAFVTPSERRNWVLFKAASVYMLTAFTCLTVGAVV